MLQRMLNALRLPMHILSGVPPAPGLVHLLHPCTSMNTPASSVPASPVASIDGRGFQHLMFPPDSSNRVQHYTKRDGVWSGLEKFNQDRFGHPTFLDCSDMQEELDKVFAGVMDALHEENSYFRTMGVIDDAGKDDMHGKRATPSAPVDRSSVRGLLASLGFTVRDSGGGVQFLGREAGRGLLLAATYGDGFSLPVEGEPVLLSLLRAEDLLEIGSFTVDASDLVAKLSTI